MQNQFISMLENNNDRLFSIELDELRVDGIDDSSDCWIEVEGNHSKLMSHLIPEKSVDFLFNGFAPRIKFSIKRGDDQVASAEIDLSGSIQSFKMTNLIEFRELLNLQGSAEGTIHCHAVCKKLKKIDRDSGNEADTVSGYFYDILLIDGVGFEESDDAYCVLKVSGSEFKSRASVNPLKVTWNQKFGMFMKEPDHVDFHVYSGSGNRLGIVRVDIPALLQGRSWGRHRSMKLPLLDSEGNKYSINIDLNLYQLIPVS